MSDIKKTVVYEDNNVIMFEVCEIVSAENINPTPYFFDIVGTVVESYIPPNKRILRYTYKEAKFNDKKKIDPLLVYYPGNMLTKINEIIEYINNN